VLLKDLAHGLLLKKRHKYPVVHPVLRRKLKQKLFQREAVGKPRRNWSYFTLI
jgi:hypothetical protein